MNRKLNSSVVISFLLMAGIQANGQTDSAPSIFNNPHRLSISPFNSVWKQPIRNRTAAGNEFHWKETSSCFQTAKLDFYRSPFVRSGISFNTGSFAGGSILFFNRAPTTNKEPNYPHTSTERSEFPKLYKASGLASFNQYARTKLNIWLPPKAEIPASHQVVGTLLYTALNIYGTWNQQVINNPILNPNFTFSKP
jgi:hypothetical protein